MKSHRQVLTLHVPARTGFVNLTDQVEAAVAASGVQEGLCLVNSMHITSSVFINDEEHGLKQDYLRWLEKLAPFNPGHDPATGGYLHNLTGEDNGDAHHKRQIMGREVVIAVTEGRLDLGTWEQVFYGEFDGRRDKRVLIKILGD
ncbi:MAG TPA: secondary thiamine-phosphate synthase enzyme YjbQ [Holophagaceae bacterium]|nr:secondary thiamine-phosphate synthase enzyme YjbQ [Holophagaceae bacterium]